MKACSHCGHTAFLKCLKTGLSFPPNKESALGIHGDLYGCRDCGEMTIHGSGAAAPWDTTIDAQPDLLNISPISYKVFSLNPNDELIEFMAKWNPEWVYD